MLTYNKSHLCFVCKPHDADDASLGVTLEDNYKGNTYNININD